MTPLSNHAVAGIESVQRIDSVAHPEYVEAVYSGVLGKIIGVYLGRPVENWSYERIAAEIGDVSYYVHEQRGRRLVITDDDISGTFTFLRALEDYGYDPELSAAQIGQTWLNYLIENTTILWWGGLGNSTEHTAYLRLKGGIAAPASGSIALNSKPVAEQIGAQIFIDGWGLICPGDAKRAVDFAERAASVSHDGEAVFGAKVVAAMVAEAFVEKRIGHLIESALKWIPADSVTTRLIQTMVRWASQTNDWRETREKLEAEFGYSMFPGQCPIIPNHGVIHLALLHGHGDFDRSLMIANTAGWDTDCNSGNVGCILGVRNGLCAFESQDWRGPVADRLYMPSADAGRAISDAVREAVSVANTGRLLANLSPLSFKNGAKFHFSLSGSVQGWMAQNDSSQVTHDRGGLRITATQPGQVAIASTPTFIPPEVKDMVTGYVLVCNPNLLPGHEVTVVATEVSAGARARMFVDRYNDVDLSTRVFGPEVEVGSQTWTIPDMDGYPIHALGIEVLGGTVRIDSVDWSGVPETSWPPVKGTMWGRAWSCSLDRFKFERDHYLYLGQNKGRGLLTQGAREWRDYAVSCDLIPRMMQKGGLALRVQGLRRYYAFLITEAKQVILTKVLDGEQTLASAPLDFEWHDTIQAEAIAVGNRITLKLNGNVVLDCEDHHNPITQGAFGFVVEDGCMGAGTPSIRPLRMGLI